MFVDVWSMWHCSPCLPLLDKHTAMHRCAGTGSQAKPAQDGAAADAQGEGASAGAESTRLKLETPLFVAEALLQAAKAQLDIEHEAAKKEARRLRNSITITTREMFVQNGRSCMDAMRIC